MLARRCSEHARIDGCTKIDGTVNYAGPLIYVNIYISNCHCFRRCSAMKFFFFLGDLLLFTLRRIQHMNNFNSLNSSWMYYTKSLKNPTSHNVCKTVFILFTFVSHQFTSNVLKILSGFPFYNYVQLLHLNNKQVLHIHMWVTQKHDLTQIIVSLLYFRETHKYVLYFKT